MPADLVQGSAAMTRAAAAALALGIASLLAATGASAQMQGTKSGGGRVAAACRAEIASYCTGLPHDGSIRKCLEARRAYLTTFCREALERR
jgi:hypothetical protein